MNDGAISVSELNEYTRRLLAGDPLLRKLTVAGEVSGWKRHISGHCYFSLKDDSSRVQCAMFRQYAQTLDFRPEDGMRVKVLAQASLYPRDGSFQLYVSAIKKEGAGDLYLAFEALKKTLMAEGLFDEARKRPIPLLPRYVGVVTSETGAAVRDIIRTARRRSPRVDILLAPCAVQGASAAPEIVAAIRRLNEDGRADVILCGRGGGSMEDLWCYNDESVARAIAASRIPVISCVGHEVDFTIADFVADARAATPTAAAELAVPVVRELKDGVDIVAGRLTRSLRHGQQMRKARLDQVLRSPAFAMPGRILTERRRIEAENLTRRLSLAMQKITDTGKNRLASLDGALRTLSPRSVMERGFSVVRGKNGILRSASSLAAGDGVRIEFARGSAEARIEEVTRDDV